MLSILLLSQKGEGYGLKPKLEDEGHLVKLWIEDKDIRASFPSGTTIDRYDQHIETADLVIECSSRFGRLCEELRTRGKLVLGSRVHELLETDIPFIKATKELLDLEFNAGKTGVNILVSSWFNGKEFQDVCITHNYQRLLNKDRGPITPSMGAITHAQPSEHLSQLKDFLTATDYRGFFALDLEVVDDQILFNRFVTSVTNSLTATLTTRLKNKFVDSLHALTTGRSFDLKDPGYTVQVVVRSLDKNLTLNTVDSRASKYVYYDIGTLGICTANGSDPREARRRTYRTISNLAPIDSIYRTDIGYSDLFEETSYEGS